MTICNTGALAAVERGTALGVVAELHARGLLEEALPLETRPLLQGARLTAWELDRMGAPHRLLVDGAAASVLARGLADVVLIGADRITANGDTANKVGSLRRSRSRRATPSSRSWSSHRSRPSTRRLRRRPDRDRGARRRRGHRLPRRAGGPGGDAHAQPRVRRRPRVPDHGDRHRPPGHPDGPRRDPGG